MEECESWDAFPDAPQRVLMLSWEDYPADAPAPLACNGFGFGDTKEEMFERLNFMELVKESEDHTYYILRYEVDDFSVSCHYDGDRLGEFDIWFHVPKAGTNS